MVTQEIEKLQKLLEEYYSFISSDTISKAIEECIKLKTMIESAANKKYPAAVESTGRS